MGRRSGNTGVRARDTPDGRGMFDASITHFLAFSLSRFLTF
jgi:hypothetical protein